jgi:putative flippase GtrA
MKIARYFLVGGASAAVDFALFGILLLMLGTPSWFMAALASFVIATAFNYVLSIRMVFSTGVRFAMRHEIVLVFLASLVGLAVNQCVLWFFYRVMEWHVLIAKCIATGSAFLWNFTARNSFIFRESK